MDLRVCIFSIVDTNKSKSSEEERAVQIVQDVNVTEKQGLNGQQGFSLVGKIFTLEQKDFRT